MRELTQKEKDKIEKNRLDSRNFWIFGVIFFVAMYLWGYVINPQPQEQQTQECSRYDEGGC